MSLRSTAQPLYTRFPIIFSSCFSKVTIGFIPRSGSPRPCRATGSPRARRGSPFGTPPPATVAFPTPSARPSSAASTPCTRVWRCRRRTRRARRGVGCGCGCARQRPTRGNSRACASAGKRGLGSTPRRRRWTSRRRRSKVGLQARARTLSPPLANSSYGCARAVPRGSVSSSIVAPAEVGRRAACHGSVTATLSGAKK